MQCYLSHACVSHASVRHIIMITKYNLITYLSISVINAFQMRLSEMFMLLLYKQAFAYLRCT